MRGMSKKAKADSYDALRDERDAYASFARYAVEAVQPGAIECVNRNDTDGGEYEYRLYCPMRADGGLIVAIWRYPGQRPNVECKLFDAWLRGIASLPDGAGYLDIKIAAERLRRARSAQIARHNAAALESRPASE